MEPAAGILIIAQTLTLRSGDVDRVAGLARHGVLAHVDVVRAETLEHGARLRD